MPLDNLYDKEYTDADFEQDVALLEQLLDRIRQRAINLTPKDRMKYSRLGYHTENWVKEIRQYMAQRPELIPSWVDMTAFDRDLETRRKLLANLDKTKQLLEMLDDTQMITGNDIINTSLAFYNNVKNASKSNMPGTTEIYKKLSSKFPGHKKKKEE